MKRIAAIAYLMVSSLLLTGCGSEIPTSLDMLFDWRENFFLETTPKLLEEQLGIIVPIIATLSMILALIGLAKMLYYVKLYPNKFFLVGMAGFISLSFILVLIPVTTTLGKQVLHPSLTLDKVFSAINVDVTNAALAAATANLGKLATMGWAINVTCLLPLYSHSYQIIMLITAIIATVTSTISGSWKGYVVIIAQVFGWALFLVLYNLLITIMGDSSTGWDLGIVSKYTYAFYVGATVLLMLGCYIGIPWLAAKFYPEEADVERRHFIADELKRAMRNPIPYASKKSSQPQQTQTSTQDKLLPGPSDDDDDDIVEGEYRPYDPKNPDINPSGTSHRNKPDVIYAPAKDSEEDKSISVHGVVIPNGNSQKQIPVIDIGKIPFEPVESKKQSTQTQASSQTESKPPTSKRKKLAQALQIAGTLTGQPKVALAGEALEFTDRIDVASKQQGKSKREVTEEVAKDYIKTRIGEKLTQNAAQQNSKLPFDPKE